MVLQVDKCGHLDMYIIAHYEAHIYTEFMITHSRTIPFSTFSLLKHHQKLHKTVIYALTKAAISLRLYARPPRRHRPNYYDL